MDNVNQTAQVWSLHRKFKLRKYKTNYLALNNKKYLVHKLTPENL